MTFHVDEGHESHSVLDAWPLGDQHVNLEAETKDEHGVGWLWIKDEHWWIFQNNQRTQQKHHLSPKHSFPIPQK